MHTHTHTHKHPQLQVCSCIHFHTHNTYCIQHTWGLLQHRTATNAYFCELSAFAMHWLLTFVNLSAIMFVTSHCPMYKWTWTGCGNKGQVAIHLNGTWYIIAVTQNSNFVYYYCPPKDCYVSYEGICYKTLLRVLTSTKLSLMST